MRPHDEQSDNPGSSRGRFCRGSWAGTPHTSLEISQIVKKAEEIMTPCAVKERRHQGE